MFASSTEITGKWYEISRNNNEYSLKRWGSRYFWLVSHFIFHKVAVSILMIVDAYFTIDGQSFPFYMLHWHFYNTEFQGFESFLNSRLIPIRKLYPELQICPVGYEHFTYFTSVESVSLERKRGNVHCGIDAIVVTTS